MKISAIVITFNEEHNIAAALQSLSWADEIVIVDAESSDRTVEIASAFTDRIFVRPWPGYSAQKNFAAEQAENDWIFSLDADERVTPELKNAILKIKDQSEPPAGYETARRTFYLGRWIKHSGWWPDRKVRLYDRHRARWRGDFVHESLEVDGRIEPLEGELLHFTVRDASEHHLRMDRYTTLAARELYDRGTHKSIGSLLLSPLIVFLRCYFFKLGFLDGIPGLAIARFAAHYEFLKNLKLWEMRSKSDV